MPIVNSTRVQCVARRTMVSHFDCQDGTPGTKVGSRSQHVLIILPVEAIH